MTIKVKMYPHPLGVKGASGIDQVVLAYGKYLPQFGIEIAHPEDEHFDLVAGHVGAGATLDKPFVSHIHGLHWTADYPCATWQYYVNAQVVDAVRKASAVTVPSAWVAETFQRDMRFTPHIIPHGIDAAEWKHDKEHSDYVLWNKNRAHDVCDASPVMALAQRFPRQHFVTTFMPRGSQGMSNVNRIGAIPHDQMKQLVQSAMVYLSTTKETFCIGVLEAMAAGVPVLGFDYGGNSLLVEHGRNGYLARPGDFDDLAEGLRYCAQYRDALGKNGQEMALQWPWERAVEMVAGVYRLVLEPEPPTVAVVIPHYNIGVEKLGRAIESVLAQNTNQAILDSIVVVDDGSTEGDIENTVKAYAKRDERIRFIRQTNSGVAVARNTGIANSGVQYIACLDADDAMHPEFIERCVRALEADRSLGIAYTGLWYIRPDGQEGLSKWPGSWNFDAHLQKQNQIPTCSVFRKELWERIGGYKSRYCPAGAGEEDAEYYLRAGAYGYKAKKIDNRGLFIYSWQSGRVSGNRDHEVTDWTAWHPWAGPNSDKQHPFASYATPERLSHPVRQYDEPTISVIIPVGPGHEDKVVNALDSLEAQTFRNWEVIVVWDCPLATSKDGVFKNDMIAKAYPYARQDFTIIERGETKGAGYARNRGAEIARAPLMLFLDADDWLYPNALEKMLHAWNEHQAIIYTDYINRAIVDDNEVKKLKRKGRWKATLKTYDDGTHLVVSAGKAFDYECERAQLQPQEDSTGNYYVWCNVTVLIPKAWHDEIGGFDEALESWEDVEYHWRLAKAAKCYHRIEEELLVYNFHFGHRRERGRQTHKNLLYYISEKHKEIEKTMCGPGCSRGRRPALRQASSVFGAQSPIQQLSSVDDDDFVTCWYIDGGNISNKMVVGAALHDKKYPQYKMVPKSTNPDLWSINYGYFGGGRRRKCLVHKKDIAAQPSMWEPIETRQAIAVPETEKEPLPPPESARLSGQPTQDLTSNISQPTPEQPAVDMGEQSLPPTVQPRPVDVDQIIGGQSQSVTGELRVSGPGEIHAQGNQVTVVQDGQITARGTITEVQAIQDSMFDLQMLPGVNKAIAERLITLGHTTRERIAALSVEELMQIKGVGEVKARMIVEAAKRERASEQ